MHKNDTAQRSIIGLFCAFQKGPVGIVYIRVKNIVDLDRAEVLISSLFLLSIYGGCLAIGWAKRWFQIDNGILSYSKIQNGPCRGKVHLVLSTVTFSQASKMIHIDSGTMLYHLKALNVDDYKAWTKTIKVFKAAEQRAAHDTVSRLVRRDSSQSRKHMHSSWVSSTNEVDQLKEIMSAMDAGFRDIKEQLDSIRAQTEATSRPGSGRERQSSLDNINSSSKFKIPKFPGLQRSKEHVLTRHKQTIWLVYLPSMHANLSNCL